MTYAVKCGKVAPTTNYKNTTKYCINMNVILQIPIADYGKIATLAAAANMPLDKYIATTAANNLVAEKKD